MQLPSWVGNPEQDFYIGGMVGWWDKWVERNGKPKSANLCLCEATRWLTDGHKYAKS